MIDNDDENNNLFICPLAAVSGRMRNKLSAYPKKRQQIIPNTHIKVLPIVF